MPPHCGRLILIANAHSDQAVIRRAHIVWGGRWPGTDRVARRQEQLANSARVTRVCGTPKETAGTFALFS